MNKSAILKWVNINLETSTKLGVFARFPPEHNTIYRLSRTNHLLLTLTEEDNHIFHKGRQSFHYKLFYNICICGF